MEKQQNTVSEVKHSLIARLKEKNQKLKKLLVDKIAILSLTVVLALALVSCNKDFSDPTTDNREMFTQDLKLTNIYTQPMTKGFDPTTWVYNYNAGSYVLTFTNVSNPAETVTKTVTVQQLQAGVSLSIYAGTYNITYQTTHLNTTTVDIKINMPNVQINGTPIALTATYDDFLIVVDVPTDDTPVIVGGAGTTMETFNLLNGFHYIYYNKKTDPTHGDLRIRFSKPSQAYSFYDMLTFAYGNIYWYASPIGAGTTITFPEWIINKITI